MWFWASFAFQSQAGFIVTVTPSFCFTFQGIEGKYILARALTERYAPKEFMIDQSLGKCLVCVLSTSVKLSVVSLSQHAVHTLCWTCVGRLCISYLSSTDVTNNNYKSWLANNNYKSRNLVVFPNVLNCNLMKATGMGLTIVEAAFWRPVQFFRVNTCVRRLFSMLKIVCPLLLQGLIWWYEITDFQ